MLKVTDLSTWYGKLQALDSVSLEVPQGGIVCLLGANGAGKSTLMKSIMGLLPRRNGTIEFEGARIDRASTQGIVQLGLALVPEGRRIFREMTVRDNLEVGSYLRRDRRQAADDMESVFTIFPVLRARDKQLAGTLSGGEQQMLAIGRALMAKPRLLLLDEPSVGLAPAITDTIFDALERINRQGTTMLLVEQNAALALSVATMAYILESGRVVASGPTATLAQDDRVRRAYLGG